MNPNIVRRTWKIESLCKKVKQVRTERQKIHLKLEKLKQDNFQLQIRVSASTTRDKLIKSRTQACTRIQACIRGFLFRKKSPVNYIQIFLEFLKQKFSNQMQRVNGRIIESKKKLDEKDRVFFSQAADLIKKGLKRAICLQNLRDITKHAVHKFDYNLGKIKVIADVYKQFVFRTNAKYILGFFKLLKLSHKKINISFKTLTSKRFTRKKWFRIDQNEERKEILVPVVESSSDRFEIPLTQSISPKKLMQSARNINLRRPASNKKGERYHKSAMKRRNTTVFKPRKSKMFSTPLHFIQKPN